MLPRIGGWDGIGIRTNVFGARIMSPVTQEAVEAERKERFNAILELE
jgi:hypothetical protein